VPKTAIRRATDDDLPQLQQIEDEADEVFASVFAITDWRPAPAGIERAQQPGFIQTASESPGSEPLGFAHVLSVPGGDHLEQLSVRPTAARRGIGRSLVEAVKRESGHRGSHSITLRTYADIPWNAPFYASCGFVEAEPDTEFLRGLLLEEQRRTITYGRRIGMVCGLSGATSLQRTACTTHDPNNAPPDVRS
jgi:GNAT superfamily N-acetyltransferase